MKFGKAVVKHRKIILIIAVLLLIPSVLGYRYTKVNFDMLTYLPGDMETVKGQDLLMEEFGKGGFSIIVTEKMKTDDMKTLTEQIRKVEHVDTALNLAAVIDPSIPTELYPEALRENIKKDDASMIVVFFDTSTSDEETLDAVTRIRKIGGRQAFVSGMSALVVDLKNVCEEEEPKYVGVAVLLSCLAMMLLLDSFLVPVLFLLSIGMAILYNLGSNIVFGEISYITKAIAAVLQLGVTMDYSIFLWHRYTENCRIEADHKDAMSRAVGQTLTSVTGSSITTIAGFLALCFMSYTMGRDLGIVMAKGVLFGVITSVTILPAMILIFDKPLQKTMHRTLLPDVGRIARGLTARPLIFIVIFVILLAPAIYGYNTKAISYDFTNLLSGQESQLREDQIQFHTAAEKLDEDFDIGCTHMIIADSDLSAKNGKAMSDEIKDIAGIKTVLGLDAILGTQIPREFAPGELTDALVKEDHQLIIVNSAYEVSTDECNDQIDAIDGIIKKYDQTATVIGEGPATKDLITLTDKDFRVVSMISIIAVFFIIFFVLRSWTLPVILISVIEFAIFLNLGISGWTGFPLNFIVPVCISTIQLGSTVDYAILMSTRYKEERSSGKEKREAVTKALSTSMSSILVSATGFFTATIGVGIYSNIGIISTFCNLMARGVVISMLAVILVLPSLLMVFDRPICRTTRGLKQIGRKAKGKAYAKE